MRLQGSLLIKNNLFYCNVLAPGQLATRVQSHTLFSMTEKLCLEIFYSLEEFVWQALAPHLVLFFTLPKYMFYNLSL